MDLLIKYGSVLRFSVLTKNPAWLVSIIIKAVASYNDNRFTQLKNMRFRIKKVSNDQEKKSEKRITWAFTFRNLLENWYVHFVICPADRFFGIQSTV